MALINCPEGKIKLPIDLWYCKITDKSCPLQASINTEKWDEFHKYCLAPKERQEGIGQAITSERYKGFHHMPGRYLCPTCKPSRKGNWDRAYHFPWELEPLEVYVPYNEEELRLEIIKHGIPSSAQFGALCRNCLNDILTRLGLPSVELQNSQPKGYGEPLNENGPIFFHMYRSVIERQSGSSQIEGTCSWCEREFSWNKDSESIVYDIYWMPSQSGKSNSFRLCEFCGDKLARLFRVT